MCFYEPIFYIPHERISQFIGCLNQTAMSFVFRGSPAGRFWWWNRHRHLQGVVLHGGSGIKLSSELDFLKGMTPKHAWCVLRNDKEERFLFNKWLSRLARLLHAWSSKWFKYLPQVIGNIAEWRSHSLRRERFGFLHFVAQTQRLQVQRSSRLFLMTFNCNLCPLPYVHPLVWKSTSIMSRLMNILQRHSLTSRTSRHLVTMDVSADLVTFAEELADAAGNVIRKSLEQHRQWCSFGMFRAGGSDSSVALSLGFDIKPSARVAMSLLL